MRRLGELLRLVAPRVEEVDLSECGLGGAAAHELARASSAPFALAGPYGE